MKKENLISRGINCLAIEANNGAYGDIKTLNGWRYVVPYYLEDGFVDIYGRGYLFKISVLCRGGDNILKIQKGKDVYEIHKGLGEEIITSDYFQSSLQPTEEEVSLLSILYPEIVELIMDFGGICEKV